jgi:hypothetical protein
VGYNCVEACGFREFCETAAGAQPGVPTTPRELTFTAEEVTRADAILEVVEGMDCLSKQSGDPAHCVVIGAATLRNALRGGITGQTS